jgi:hypothetical protein
MKPLTVFTKNRARKDGRNSSCPTCHSKYTRAHYAKNKAYYKAKARNHTNKLRAIIDKAKDRPCKDCGKKYHPKAMDLDHVRGKKVAPLSLMRIHCMSFAAVRAEIAKCDVRCAICHRLRTYGLPPLRPGGTRHRSTKPV